MNRNIALYVKDILDSMENAEKFVEGMTCEEFNGDIKTSYAVSMHLVTAALVQFDGNG